MFHRKLEREFPLKNLWKHHGMMKFKNTLHLYRTRWDNNKNYDKRETYLS